ncbi:BclA C-terminal domain-containing protein [Paenibacillus segetis]|uniref:BclA C-terminal domain-containing protein n=1 Tax=Paenibacillus segetis TaxID=1325360 RepID=A0ABQ1YU89_9BACL|nr:collagen-like protein [Paenibacillus segetis]GGH37905.1 hypothetical protein GCM10008013_45610 [Paenibacillus segetis]
MTGPTGPESLVYGLTQFGYIYNLEARIVGIEVDVIFDTNGILTSGITHVPGTTRIEVTNQGSYEVVFLVSCVEPSQFALFINDILVPGSVYGSGIGTQLINGQSIIALTAGDFITLRNHSSAAPVTLQTQAGGSQNSVNTFVVIKKIA